jgi:tRNA A37 threonylcarbamoyladenosine dehydratase
MAEGSCARTELLIGRAGVVRLAGAHVLVAGLGGVGGHAAEALGRAGVGTLTLVDHDVVAQSNLNRQVLALTSTLGRPKTAVMAERLHEINPELEVRVRAQFVDQRTAGEILASERPHFVADCIDTVGPKTTLIAACLEQGIPVVSSMGAGGRLDPTRVHVTRLNQTYGCGLARAVRRRLKALGLRPALTVVFSDEPVRGAGLDESNGAEAVKGPEGSGVFPESPGIGSRAVTGTISFMPALFGLMVAGVILNRLLGASGAVPEA